MVEALHASVSEAAFLITQSWDRQDDTRLGRCDVP